MNYYSILLGVISLNCLSFALGFDSSPLQDFCVADLTSPVSVNGFACKDPKHVEASDFFFSGLHKVGNTSNKLGLKVTPVFVTQLPGLNTLGLSLVRIDFALSGINPPHTHPRASEMFTVLEGTVEVGFITNSPDNRLIKKVLKKGDVFVFPIGLVHYQKNVGNCNAVAVAGLNSQNPGVNIIANAVFKSNPLISTGFLAKAFRTETTTIEKIKRSI